MFIKSEVLPNFKFSEKPLEVLLKANISLLSNNKEAPTGKDVPNNKWYLLSVEESYIYKSTVIAAVSTFVNSIDFILYIFQNPLKNL